MLAETHQLQLVTTGTLWIDAMQVEPGSMATEYQSALPVRGVAFAADIADVDAANSVHRRTGDRRLRGDGQILRGGI